MSLRSHSITSDINLEEIVKDLPVYEQWELLQMLWDLVKENGGNLDWGFFYKDNGIQDI